MNLKKLGIGAYLTAAAAVLGVVGLICTVVSSTMRVDSALQGLPLIVLAAIVGIALCCVAVFAGSKFGDHNPICAAAVLGAIALYFVTFGSAVGQRIMMIAGLFSYNAGDTVGWSIFYVSVAAWVCLIVGSVLLVIGSFLKTVKE